MSIVEKTVDVLLAQTASRSDLNRWSNPDQLRSKPDYTSLFQAVDEGNTQDIKAALLSLQKHPWYANFLLGIRGNRKRLTAALRDFRQVESTLTPEEMGKRMHELDSISINLENLVVEDALSEKLKKEFPSGNVLIHATSLKSMLDIISMGSVMNYVALERLYKNNMNGSVPASIGGSVGVSFYLNEVASLLPATTGYAVFFLISPEKILQSGLKLVTPLDASVNRELQAVTSAYSGEELVKWKRKVGVLESMMTDLYYLDKQIQVLKDIANDNTKKIAITSAGVLDALSHLYTGDPDFNQISSYYSFEDEFPIVKDEEVLSEQKLSLILIHYVVTYCLGKSWEEIKQMDLLQVLDMFNSQRERIAELVKKRRSQRSAYLNNDTDISLAISDLVLFLPRKDKNVWLHRLANANQKPLAFVFFDSSNGPKVGSEFSAAYKRPIGDMAAYQKVINAFTTASGLPDPSVQYHQLLGIPPEELARRIGKRGEVPRDLLQDSKKLVLKDGKLDLSES